ncbi:uncharacterized protein BJ171DRAFT_557508 [Polychytrium aggregatum]|uniref:uncharacterized protein n=1 Tax=Polychytrium aggregatum TaxID=110093 RepID=UPI0022FF12E4|nr:uncharacterized protein BJ171DRAFT_557508 [Polychytrium aggregatum]KAI9209834.1 hypothetical protein BJ171DRAFT_557508 [Polychytrium aggregatum]
MSEIEEFDEQFQELVDSIKSVLDSEISKLRGQERIEKCSYLKNRLTRARQVHRSIMVEIRQLPAEQAEEWKTKAGSYDTLMSKLAQDIEWAETSAAKDDKKKAVDDMTTKEITQQAMALQEKTHQSATNALRRVEETIQVAVETSTEIKRQGEQINKISDDVDQVEDNLRRADKQLKAFIRRMATDKIFMVFIFLIVIGIIAAIVLYVLKSKGLLSGI